jgi:predicted dehydrogenase
MADGSTAYFGSHREMQDRSGRFALQVYGSEGILEIQEGSMPQVKYLDDPTWSPGRSGAKWQDVSSAGIGVPEPLKGREYRARHTLGVRDLLDAIENDREPSCNAEVSRGVTEIILSAYESHRLNQPVTLPLKTRVHPFTKPFAASSSATS